MKTNLFLPLGLSTLLAVAGCSDGVSSEEDAKAAYLGLDASLDRR
jgi:hypothetical protein